MENIMTLSGIKKFYGKGDGQVKALNGATLTVHQGEMCAVMGKSGSGKSTLLYVMAGLNKVDAGEYLFANGKVNLKNPNALSRFRRDNIGLVVQNFALIEDQTVYYNVALPLKYQGVRKKEIRRRVTEMLELLEISDKSACYPGQLSGGQQQRVSIARALIKQPEVILADEPTGSVDEATEDNIMALFRRVNRELGKTVVIVTHDDKVGRLCDRIIKLADGVVVSENFSLEPVPEPPAAQAPSEAPALMEHNVFPEAVAAEEETVRVEAERAPDPESPVPQDAMPCPEFRSEVLDRLEKNELRYPADPSPVATAEHPRPDKTVRLNRLEKYILKMEKKRSQRTKP